MGISYEQYKNNMRRQGKIPVSREEFDSKMSDSYNSAKNLEESASNVAQKGGFIGFLGKVMVSMAQSVERMAK